MDNKLTHLPLVIYVQRFSMNQLTLLQNHDYIPSPQRFINAELALRTYSRCNSVARVYSFNTNPNRAVTFRRRYYHSNDRNIFLFVEFLYYLLAHTRFISPR